MVKLDFDVGDYIANAYGCGTIEKIVITKHAITIHSDYFHPIDMNGFAVVDADKAEWDSDYVTSKSTDSIAKWAMIVNEKWKSWQEEN